MQASSGFISPLHKLVVYIVVTESPDPPLCGPGHSKDKCWVPSNSVGGIALDPTHFNTSNATAKQEAWELHNACMTLGTEIAKLSPDLILLSTPHGIADLTQFLFYLNPQGFGWADTDNCGCPPCCYNVSVSIDANRSLELVEVLEVSWRHLSVVILTILLVS